jgi:tRNA nucleotidyltransferase (CCA-adding enzyme)
MSADIMGYVPGAFMDAVTAIAGEAARRGGQALLVGGCVRDAMFFDQGHPWGADIIKQSKDLDVEVYGVPASELRAMLEGMFEVDAVGEAFSVYKLKGLPIDVSLPRRDNKTGEGHRGFEVEGDHTMTVEEAAARRDFTINSMAWDPIAGRLHDPYHGERACRARLLQNTSDAFSEDPLRVLRGVQFIARFGLQWTPALREISQGLALVAAWNELSRERIFDELMKLLLKGRDMLAAMTFLKSSCWVMAFPELNRLIECRQNPKWHPEGDVYTHTAQCLECFARERTGDPEEDAIVGLAVLCHDFGKPDTYSIGEDGEIHHYAHNKVGVPIAEKFLANLAGENHKWIPQVLPLVKRHMAPLALYQDDATDRAIRRLARDVKRIDRLLRVFRADTGGRTNQVGKLGLSVIQERDMVCDWLKARAAKLDVADKAPEPIVMGRHLLDHGWVSGPLMGKALKALYELQLNGEVDSVSEGLVRAGPWLSDPDLIPEPVPAQEETGVRK